MHVEAVSEGERSQDRQDEGADAQLSDDSPVVSEPQVGDHTRQKRVEPEPEVDTEHSETKAEDPKTEEEPIISPPVTPGLPEDTPTKSRRRPRSRSRGRNSKDFKGKAKPTQFTNPTAATSFANDSSPDEGPVASTSQPNGFTLPPLMSPIPARLALLQAPRILASPEPGMLYPGTSPPTPMIPTLQDIQRGFLRPNSAAARLMAIHLAGPGSYDPSLISPPVTPPHPGKLTRYNTVGGGGGERIAARKVMLRHIGKRLKAEAEHTSGGEDPPPATPSRRKRRSKRSSVNRPDVVDDREPPSAASPTTPVLQMPALPLPTSETARDESDAQPYLPARSPTPNPRSPSVERSRKHALDILTGVSPSSTTYRYETPLERRGPVVEEDDAPDHDHSQASPVPRSTYNRRSDTPPEVPSPHPPHAPVAPPDISAESADDGGVPAYTPNTAQDQPHVFPTSPFATPLRERQGPDEEEEDSHTENDTPRRPPWNDAYDRQISWVAEPGQFLKYDASSL
jgi:serine/arginine repetitive matrix protein 2